MNQKEIAAAAESIVSNLSFSLMQRLKWFHLGFKNNDFVLMFGHACNYCTACGVATAVG